MGPLILVVGPSGAGKDSLIDGGRGALADDPGIHFVRRTVTRAASSDEDHDSLSLAEFEAAERAGAFLLSWRAHGLAYGIPASVQALRSDGIAVVANVSRTVVDDARRRLAPVRIIVVTAPEPFLAERLRRRGREGGDAAAARLAAAAVTLPTGPDVVTVINDRSLEEGQAAFLAALRQGVTPPVA
jgi:phosphonate metabolism protein PhnN/1,5-bisphosphokinase (PRPP-forming)